MLHGMIAVIHAAMIPMVHGTVIHANVPTAVAAAG